VCVCTLCAFVPARAAPELPAAALALEAEVARGRDARGITRSPSTTLSAPYVCKSNSNAEKAITRQCQGRENGRGAEGYGLWESNDLAPSQVERKKGRSS